VELKKPLMVSRLGATELACLCFFLEKRATTSRPYPAVVKAAISSNAGVFPATDAILDRFAEMFLGHVQSADIMAIFFGRYEHVVCNARCPDATFVEFGCLAPFGFDTPWTSGLQGRTVLVVHPFADSIMKQYRERRELLFATGDVLPEFELKTIRAVQSILNVKVGFATWFDAYEHMCGQIAATTFDVAIIGAGAYGLPLASFVKGLGKQAVHLGGITQILFGIKGRRWETECADTIGKLFNEHWIRPSDAERPDGYFRIEDGCYW
jgi:hypothetical protein